MERSIPVFPLNEKYIIDVSAERLKACKVMRNDFAVQIRRCNTEGDATGQFKFYVDMVRDESRKESRIAYLFMQEYLLCPDAAERRREALESLRKWLRSAVDRRVRWGKSDRERSYSKIDLRLRQKNLTYEEEVEFFSVLFMIERLVAWER